MNELQFLLNFAQIQARLGGGVGGSVRFADIMEYSNVSRTGAYYHINNLIDLGLIMRKKRGFYCLTYHIGLVSIGASLISAIDVMEFQAYPHEYLYQFWEANNVK